jgi:hypothetical protein
MKTNAITISIRSAIYLWIHIQLQREGLSDYVGLDKNAKLYQHSKVNHFSKFFSVYTEAMGTASF